MAHEQRPRRFLAGFASLPDAMDEGTRSGQFQASQTESLEILPASGGVSPHLRRDFISTALRVFLSAGFQRSPSRLRPFVSFGRLAEKAQSAVRRDPRWRKLPENAPRSEIQ